MYYNIPTHDPHVLKLNMAPFIARVYTQLSLPKQFFMDTIWKEQSINCVLNTFCISKVHYQYYHASSVLLKRRKLKEIKDIKKLLKDQYLKAPTMEFEQPTKTYSIPTVEIWSNITVAELAERVNRDIRDILDFLVIKYRNQYFSKNSTLSNDIIVEITKGCGAKVKFIPMPNNNTKEKITYEDIIKRSPPKKYQLVKRHPVVTIMGHVDHGKTTLLDALRNTSVVKSEFGGITQHIGAFNVTLESGERVTFLDTPGHAAFASMRYRGAHATDIVVLVVAADDGVKDQTVQSIKMAKKANVPIIVAINKIDKPNIDISKTQHELAQHGVIVEELGGDTQCIQISALKGINLVELTEAIVIQADVMDLTGDPVGLVEGVVIECRNDIARGKLVTALIRRGTLKKRCLLVSGLAWAKVRAMFNDSGHPVTEAKLSEAVEIIGWKKLPNVGDEILEMKDDKMLHTALKYKEDEYNKTLALEHKVMADMREEEYLKEYKNRLKVKQYFGKDREIMRTLLETKRKSEAERQRKSNTNNIPTINVIIKGDVAGSVETILDIFDTYKSNEICRLNVIHYGVGPIVETDVQLAETFNGIIYGFNVNINKKLEEEAVQKSIAVRLYNVVYNLVDDIKETINSVLPEIDVEDVIGEAEVLQNFEINQKKKTRTFIAGCRCISGVLLKSAMYNIIRNNEIIYKGKLVSMKHLKKEVSSIAINLECGLRFDDPTIAFLPGDTIVCYNLKKERQTIDWNPGF